VENCIVVADGGRSDSDAVVPLRSKHVSDAFLTRQPSRVVHTMADKA
jgi:hypothetical protein